MIDNNSRYIYEVYRSKSVSLAAKKLFLSQPALSASIKKAEKELGYAIFNRKTLPFTLTPQGQLYINAIEKIIKIEEETQVRIQNLDENENGTLRIAMSSQLSFCAIPKICSMFSKKHPNIDISIEVCKTEELPFFLKKDLADLVFTSVKLDSNEFKTVSLFQENYIVVMSKNSKIPKKLLPYALSRDEILNRSYSRKKMITDMSCFHGVEFVYSPPNTNIYRKRKLVLGQANVSHHVISNTLIFQLSYNLSKAGFGAFFVTDAYLAAMPTDDRCIYFAVKDFDVPQSFNAIYAKEEGPSRELAKEFVATAKELFNTDNPLSVLSQ